MQYEPFITMKLIPLFSPGDYSPIIIFWHYFKEKSVTNSPLKPDSPEYFFHHFFTVNYHTGEIEPSAHADENAQYRANITLKLYGLNAPKRKTMRLREWRFYSNESNPHIDDFNYRYFLE